MHIHCSPNSDSTIWRNNAGIVSGELAIFWSKHHRMASVIDYHCSDLLIFVGDANDSNLSID